MIPKIKIVSLNLFGVLLSKHSKRVSQRAIVAKLAMRAQGCSRNREFTPGNEMKCQVHTTFGRDVITITFQEVTSSLACYETEPTLLSYIFTTIYKV